MRWLDKIELPYYVKKIESWGRDGTRGRCTDDCEQEKICGLIFSVSGDDF